MTLWLRALLATLFLGLYVSLGSPARSQTPALKNVYNVMSTYGAKCDGRTDDATSINNALSAARTAGGGVVYFPPSPTKSLVGTALIVASNVTLWAFPGSVTIAPTTTSTSSELLSTSLISNVLIYGLTFDDTGLTTCTSMNCATLFAYKSSNVILDHVTVKNTVSFGIEFSNDSRSRVRDSLFDNVAYSAAGYTDSAAAVLMCCGDGAPGDAAPGTGSFAIATTFVNTGYDSVSTSYQNDLLVSF